MTSTDSSFENFYDNVVAKAYPLVTKKLAEKASFHPDSFSFTPFTQAYETTADKIDSAQRLHSEVDGSPGHPMSAASTVLIDSRTNLTALLKKDAEKFYHGRNLDDGSAYMDQLSTRFRN